jgi:hypothetical protein
MTSMTFDGSDRHGALGEIQNLHELPDRARRMLLSQQPFEVCDLPLPLLTIRSQEPRLPDPAGAIRPRLDDCGSSRNCPCSLISTVSAATPVQAIPPPSGFLHNL